MNDVSYVQSLRKHMRGANPVDLSVPDAQAPPPHSLAAHSARPFTQAVREKVLNETLRQMSPRSLRVCCLFIRVAARFGGRLEQKDSSHFQRAR